MSKSKWELIGEDFSVYSFEANPVFVGAYLSTKDVKPDDPKKKPFKLHRFVDIETGEEVNIPDVYAVSNALDSVEDPKLYAFRFEFKGKKEIGRGRTVNSIIAQKMLLSEIED